MSECIVYQISGYPVAVLTPIIPQYSPTGELEETQRSVIEIGIKDVPTGEPFWVVDTSTLPTDRTFRNAWKIDPSVMGTPSGFGTRVE